MFNIESEPELMQLAEIAESMRTIAPIALRVNPDIDAHTHTYTTTAKKENKFGLPLKNAIAVYKKSLLSSLCQSHRHRRPSGLAHPLAGALQKSPRYIVGAGCGVTLA